MVLAARLRHDRQLTGLAVLSNLVGEVRSELIKDAECIEGALRGSERINSYADAVATYLAIAVGRVALYGSSLCRWLTKDNALGAAIPQKAIEMSWDFAEANILGDSSASLTLCANNIANCLLNLNYGSTNEALISHQDARSVSVPRSVIWNTDPPYYDNIGYADISEYFYVWHRRALSGIWPELFRRIGTNKCDELVATPFRERRPLTVSEYTWGSFDAEMKAEVFFLEEIKRAFRKMRAAAASDYPAVVYYAFRQQAETDESVSSAG